MVQRSRQWNLDLEYVYSMKRKALIALIATILVGCNYEDAPNCLRTEGAPVSRELSLPEFSKVVIEDDLQLLIRQGNEQRVVLESGANLIDDIVVQVDRGTLRATNGVRCNLFRGYAVNTLIITVPDLQAVRNSSAFDVRGEGVLSFNSLTLQSNTSPGPGYPQKGGDFYLNLRCEQLSISANGQSVFYLQGSVGQARVSFSDEFPRLEAGALFINDLDILQRSAAPMIVYPMQSITGEIRGTGDVIALNRPPVVSVTEFFSGRLIFTDP